MSTDSRRAQSFLTPRLVLGVCIALFGLVLAIDRTTLLDADRVLRFWPVALIAVGAILFQNARDSGGSGVNGAVLMVLGAWLLLNTLGVTRVGFWDLFWPAVLILIGTRLVLPTIRKSVNAASGDAGETVAVFAVLGGFKRISKSPRFRGGEITAFMGGGQLDLREAVIPPGEDAVIDVFGMMGGCELRVPPAWTVDSRVVAIMGGVDDARKETPVDVAVPSSLAPPRLVLRGLLLMGGMQIKN